MRDTTFAKAVVDAVRKIDCRKISCPNFKAAIRNLRVLIRLYDKSVEDGSIGYWGYLAFANDPNWQGRWGYACIGLPFLTSGSIEILFSAKKITEKKYHTYRNFIDAFDEAAMITNYGQEFYNADNLPLNITMDVLLVLITALEFYLKTLPEEKKPDNRIVKIIGKGYRLFMDATIGAGVGYYSIAILQGFGLSLSPLASGSVQTITGAVYALTNLKEPQQHTTKLTTLLRNYFYLRLFINALYHGTEIGAFLSIMLFDMITDIRNSSYISDTNFYLVFGIALFHVFLAAGYFWHDEKTEITELKNRPDQIPILTDSSSSTIQAKNVQKTTPWLRDCLKFMHKKDASTPVLTEEPTAIEVVSSGNTKKPPATQMQQ